eukprot:TRINITY_DN6129_c0_g1_i1.p1 TRINITY_DN6129_c0_g1~~TRINITY_DN6129_c0_g1_i1.p1  ORF type:complete len:398 (+),score=65.55 TRINITY_DN6129_c0_g1_i1:34-1227(+)
MAFTGGAYEQSGGMMGPPPPMSGAVEQHMLQEEEMVNGSVLHGAVKSCLKIFSGRVSSTPTASLPSTDDMGLLMFLNLKQSHLNRATAGVDLYKYPALKPLLSIIEFVNYVVGGLIVEAEKVDEMHIAIKKELIRREARLDYHIYDQRVRNKGGGSQVEQVLAVHFPQGPQISTRSSHLYSNANPEATEALQLIGDDRWVLNELRAHLRVASQCRSMLHGKSPGGIDPNLADGIVHELGIAQTFRKAMHKVKDVSNELKDKDALPALQTLSQFMDYLHYGVSVALDELENCELMLRKRSVGAVADRKIHALEMKDKENKRSSCSALRFNSIVNSPKKRSTTASHPHRVFSSRPAENTIRISPTRSTRSNVSSTVTERARETELLHTDDCFLDAYCCD